MAKAKKRRAPIVHYVSPSYHGPAWCNSLLYPENIRSSGDWSKVTCKRCRRTADA